MDYRLLIARRYLVSRRRLTLISVITGVSVAGVAVGVAALVVVLSVMNGFFDVVRDLLVSYDPHVRIEATGVGGIARPDTLAALALAEPGVTSATPFVEGQALLTTEGAGTLNQVVVVRGVDPDALDAEARASIVDGAFDVSRRGGQAGVVIGNALAQKQFGFAKLADAGQFVIDAYPVSIRPFDVALIAVAAVALCAVAAVYPATRAAAVDPARAVQGDG